MWFLPVLAKSSAVLLASLGKYTAGTYTAVSAQSVFSAAGTSIFSTILLVYSVIDSRDSMSNKNNYPCKLLRGESPGDSPKRILLEISLRSL